MELSIKLSVEETNLVLGALSKLPYDVSVSLIDKIKAQATAQIVESQAEKTDKKSEKKLSKTPA